MCQNENCRIIFVLLGSCTGQEEEEEDSGAVAPGVAPKMSAAKAAKSAAEKDARIAVGYMLSKFPSCSCLLPYWKVAARPKFTEATQGAATASSSDAAVKCCCVCGLCIPHTFSSDLRGVEQR